MQLILGVDGGGTKTLAVAADLDGRVRGVGRSGGSNFQGVGLHAARENLAAAIGAALAQAGADPAGVLFATYGLSGADRPGDFATFREVLRQVGPGGSFLLVNDTTIALRAGTPNGVGVALIAGTGANTIGFNADGEQAKVGGLGRLTGDYGSAGQIVEAAVVAAMKGEDGRGRPTALAGNLASALGLAALVDVIEFEFADRFRPWEPGTFAPVVFRTAADGDGVALDLLRDIGEEMALCALTALRRLFDPSDPVTVVLGGSVLQKAEIPILPDTIRARVTAAYPHASIVRLEVEPVVGAVLFCYDHLLEMVEPDLAARLDAGIRDRSCRSG